MGFSVINQPFWGSPIYGNTHIATSHHFRFILPISRQILGFFCTLRQSNMACWKIHHLVRGFSQLYEPPCISLFSGCSNIFQYKFHIFSISFLDKLSIKTSMSHIFPIVSHIFPIDSHNFHIPPIFSHNESPPNKPPNARPPPDGQRDLRRIATFQGASLGKI